jgi:arylsulfatase A-like enzyme
MIIRWPGHTRPGAQDDTPVLSTDFFPTMLTMAGLSPSSGVPLDGADLTPALQETGEVDRDALFWHFPHYHGSGNRPCGAVRMGRWKLLEWFEDGALELYDLEADPGERRNLAEEDPDRARALLERLRAWRVEVDAKMPRRESGEELPIGG